MEEPKHWVLVCRCSRGKPTVRLRGFAFDGEGTLHLLGMCIICLGTIKVTHTAEDIANDVAYAAQYEEWQRTHNAEEQIAQLRDELDNINWDDLGDGT